MIANYPHLDALVALDLIAARAALNLHKTAVNEGERVLLVVDESQTTVTYLLLWKDISVLDRQALHCEIEWTAMVLPVDVALILLDEMVVDVLWLVMRLEQLLETSRVGGFLIDLWEAFLPLVDDLKVKVRKIGEYERWQISFVELCDCLIAVYEFHLRLLGAGTILERHQSLKDP